MIAEIASPKATEEDAELIRKQLRASGLHYDAPTESAHDSEEWAANT